MHASQETMNRIVDALEKSAHAEIARLYREAGIDPSDELVSETFSSFSNALRNELLDGGPHTSTPEVD